MRTEIITATIDVRAYVAGALTIATIIIAILFVMMDLNKRTKQECFLINMVDQILRDLIDPRINYLSYSLGGSKEPCTLNIEKDNLRAKTEDCGPMMYGKYQLSYVWYGPYQGDKTKITVMLKRKKRNGEMVLIYDRITSVKL